MQGTQVRLLGWKDPWKRKWQLTPVSCLGNLMDRGAWQATVHGVAKSQTQLSDQTTSTELVSKQCTFCLFSNVLFIYLAASGLSCSTWDIQSLLCHTRSLIAECKLLVMADGI